MSVDMKRNKKSDKEIFWLMSKMKHVPYGPYEKYIKRPMDFVFSLIALVILSPLLLILTVTGAICMGGNPFYIQLRPGKDEKIFKLIKFRSMNNKKDNEGNLLSDDKRLTKYGKFIRETSLDELPELINIIKGEMSIVGPRPLLPRYLPRYNEHQARRHEVRPGITGLAQINGRNVISWEKKFDWDVKYVNRITFLVDLGIIFSTIKVVLKQEGFSLEYIDEFWGTPE